MQTLHDRALAADVAALYGRSLLNDEFLSVIAAQSDRALDDGVQGFTSDAGFDRYSVMVIRDDFSSADSCVILGGLHNTPPEFVHEWENVEAGRKDPVMQQCKHSSAPFVYGQDTYVRAGFVEKWEQQAPFGYAYGITSTFHHLPRNLHVIFSVDRLRPLPAHRTELADLVARVHLFGTFAQCAALSLLNSSVESELEIKGRIRLSRREHECLQWAAEGKTAWETGMLLSIAEASVAKVLAAAIRRMGCVTKPQAVAKALRLGLIS